MTPLETTALLAKIVFVLAVVLTVVPFMVWFERRGSAWIQGRVGPNRVGPFGLMQPLADVIKFLFKEAFIPGHVSKGLYLLAPFIALIAPLVGLAVLPFGSSIMFYGTEIPLQITQLNMGFLLLLAFGALEVYPVLLAGWSSNSKYAVLGALRGSSQMISYEIAMGIALVSTIMIYGSVDLQEIVRFQHRPLFGSIPAWGAFLNPVGLLVFWISIFAETNRLPFDLPEGEAEIVAGYHTEYSSVKFALFFMAEYIAMTVASALLVTLFFGGYQLLPGMSALAEWITSTWNLGLDGTHNVRACLEMTSFGFKVGISMFIYVWVRWTLPRFRFDQLMDLGWNILLPLSFVNLLIVAAVLYFLERTP